MRTIIDLPEEQVEALDELVEKQATSRAALIRSAINLLLEHERRQAKALAEAFGAWSKPPVISSVLVPIVQPEVAQGASSISETTLILHEAASEPAPAVNTVPEPEPVKPDTVTPVAEVDPSPEPPVAAEKLPPHVAAAGEAIWPASFFFAPANKPKPDGEAP
jgi:Arc/MetJ-type ribon-helix-helix transcriptional regulator